jgi:tetratricopeptide (TPR) repeat protein
MNINKAAIESRAIDAAMSQQWEEAIMLNLQLLELNDNDISILLRLGYAYLQHGDYPNATKIYKTVLKQQSAHPIANENLERIQVLEQLANKPQTRKSSKYNPSLFLEIPGKTKVSVLVNLGQKDILAILNTGDEVEVKLRRRKIEIRTTEGEYVGCLPDDLSKRLYVFIKAGGEYSCFIKEISLNRVVVFIKEGIKARRMQKYSSFPRNIQSNLQAMQDGAQPVEGEVDPDKVSDEETDDLSENELERLAENLGQEDKEEYFNIENVDTDDEENLEE